MLSLRNLHTPTTSRCKGSLDLDSVVTTYNLDGRKVDSSKNECCRLSFLVSFEQVERSYKKYNPECLSLEKCKLTIFCIIYFKNPQDNFSVFVHSVMKVLRNLQTSFDYILISVFQFNINNPISIWEDSYVRFEIVYLCSIINKRHHIE